MIAISPSKKSSIAMITSSRPAKPIQPLQRSLVAIRRSFPAVAPPLVRSWRRLSCGWLTRHTERLPVDPGDDVAAEPDEHVAPRKLEPHLPEGVGRALPVPRDVDAERSPVHRVECVHERTLVRAGVEGVRPGAVAALGAGQRHAGHLLVGLTSV